MANKKAKALGINHIVLEVEDLDKALEFYGKLFEIGLRGRNEHNAFIDIVDKSSLTSEQFLLDNQRANISNLAN